MIASMCASMLTFSACQHSQVEARYGMALDENITQMSANLWPDEPGSAPIELDPLTGEAVAERYYKAQKQAADSAAPQTLIEIDTN